MRYENRNPPEGINTSEHRPVREFLRLSLFALIALVVVGALLNFTGSVIGGLLPFRAELWLTQRVDRIMRESGQESPFQDALDTSQHSDQHADQLLQQYLQSLAHKVEAALELEEPIVITLHYSDDEVINAYATLGGHVFFFKGLLRQLPHENALSMLMAHEFSHVGQRHPVRSIGGGLTLMAGSSLLLGAAAFENRFFSMATALASTRFSRAMETEADLHALQAVNKIYGHVNGTDDLFKLFVEFRREGEFEVELLDSFFSTHPLDENRIEAIAQQSLNNGWDSNGDVTPLPEQFIAWLRVIAL